VLLGEAGFTVIDAATGRALLQHLRSPARIDIVVTNTRIGGMPGWEVARSTAELRAGLPTVRIIESRADAVPLYGEDPASVAILQKPFTITALVSAIRTLLAYRSEMVPVVERVVPTWLR
jgi:DNA-binding response OmpR family regulator